MSLRRAIPVVLVIAAAIAVAVLAGGGEPGQPGAPTTPGRFPSPTMSVRPGHIVGSVRDVNDRPVAGARVRVLGRRATARSNRYGRFALRPGPGRLTVVTDVPAYVPQAVSTTVTRRRGARVDFALAISDPNRVSVPNSADRIIMWTSCEQLARLREDQLRTWKRRGVDGFVCQTRFLRGFGGDQGFADKRVSKLRGAEYRLQRQIDASPAARLARKRELLLYLGFYTASYFNSRTPLKDWFDDRGWSHEVLPRVQDIAAAARSMGFAGLAVDQELYPQQDGARTSSWAWSYPGNRRTEADVRAKVKERGRQLMKHMLDAYPGLELVAYDTRLPGTWQAKVAADVSKLPNPSADDVRIDLWDGLSSVSGYSAIRWMDAVFHKTVHLPGASWDTALEYNANATYSELSRYFSNWSYASSRLHLSPFSWIDDGPTDTKFTNARGPSYVAEQLDAFKRWGAGGAFANYAYGDFDGFDYGPYVDALRRASTPARVDRSPPTLTLTTPDAQRPLIRGQRIDVTGEARDDFAIRAIRWYDDRGRQGAARLTWMFSGDERSGWKGVTRWSIDNLKVASDARRITITAEDIHGLARLLPLTVSR